MIHAIRIRPLKVLSMTTAVMGVLVATSVSFATRPSVPQTQMTGDRLSQVGSPVGIGAGVSASTRGPSAFAYLEFDWDGPNAVPGFGPWRNEAASRRAAEVVPAR